MKRPKPSALLWLFPVPFVAWGAVLLAQSFPSGARLDEVLDNFTQALKAPFALRWTERTGAFVLAAVVLYVLSALSLIHI